MLAAARDRGWSDWHKKKSDEVVICQRICTSMRVLKMDDDFYKSPIPDTCGYGCTVIDEVVSNDLQEG